MLTSVNYYTSPSSITEILYRYAALLLPSQIAEGLNQLDYNFPIYDTYNLMHENTCLPYIYHSKALA